MTLKWSQGRMGEEQQKGRGGIEEKGLKEAMDDNVEMDQRQNG